MSDVARALAAIDLLNSEDPNLIDDSGVLRPKELVHAERMTAWLERLDPEADAAQQLAARAHHLRRWSYPRTDYPAGRSGYLQWRTHARRAHAAALEELLLSFDIEPSVREDAARIVVKDGLGTDRRVQIHEDALCLVFLELQGAETASKLGTQADTVLLKTLAKMSPLGREAIVEADLDHEFKGLLDRLLLADLE